MQTMTLSIPGPWLRGRSRTVTACRTGPLSSLYRWSPRSPLSWDSYDSEVQQTDRIL